MPFKKGMSGNPNGRPRKERTLTAILEQAGAKAIDTGEGKKVSSRRLLASMLWQALMTGDVVFPPDEKGKRLTYKLEPRDWRDIAEFMYRQIDGPPPAQHEVSGPDGAPITIRIVDDTDSDPRDSD